MDKLFERVIYVATQIIWYIVPGFMLMFATIVPFIIISPSDTLAVLNGIGGFIWFAVGILLGFLMEGLRLYRLRPGYNRIKQHFFSQLQLPFHREDDSRDLNPYYILDHIYDLATEKKYETIRLYHSIWIMLGQLSMILLISGLIYFPAIAILNYGVYSHTLIWGENASTKLYIGIWIGISVLTTAMGIRILCISLEEQKKVNKMYLEFMLSNLQELKQRIL